MKGKNQGKLGKKEEEMKERRQDGGKEKYLLYYSCSKIFLFLKTLFYSNDTQNQACITIIDI